MPEQSGREACRALQTRVRRIDLCYQRQNDHQGRHNHIMKHPEKMVRFLGLLDTIHMSRCGQSRRTLGLRLLSGG